MVSYFRIVSCLYIWRLAQDPTSLTGLIRTKPPHNNILAQGKEYYGTKSLGIVYSASPETTVPANKLVLDGYYDFDWGNDRDTRKRVSGYVHCVVGGGNGRRPDDKALLFNSPLRWSTSLNANSWFINQNINRLTYSKLAIKFPKTWDV
ncbi:Hypothetical protein PHPALM_17144 [Phytophthora palmivora]|uniref:Uncharacterized protein n=1 Tax=Phytophthora palmivora TaxID=4796 RepID=A0A2P4XMY9_9STRA|nr:Hypothetical protein PHPALM_17144 [Phytophthora palmivora]